VTARRKTPDEQCKREIGGNKKRCGGEDGDWLKSTPREMVRRPCTNEGAMLAQP
jgi:hypothetical protein